MLSQRSPTLGAVVGHGPELEREEGAASVLGRLGAEVATLDLRDEPARLFEDKMGYSPA